MKMTIAITKDVPISFINVFDSKINYLYIIKKQGYRLSLEYMRIDAAIPLYDAFRQTWKYYR